MIIIKNLENSSKTFIHKTLNVNPNMVKIKRIYNNNH
jgi:hypothetical protein